MPYLWRVSPREIWERSILIEAETAREAIEKVMEGEGDQEALRPLRTYDPSEWPVELVQAEQVITTLWSALNDLYQVANNRIPDELVTAQAGSVLTDVAQEIERMTSSADEQTD